MTEVGADPGLGAEDEIDRLVFKGLSAPLSASDSARLDALVSTSSANARRAEALIRTWTLAGVLEPRGVAEPARGVVTRRGLIAAGLAAAIVGPAVVWMRAQPAYKSYVAPGDGPLKATLEDGTQIALSRGGRLEARLGPGRRDIRLIAGEAFFAVAKDAGRPFQVEVGDHRLTVLGTRFNVDPRASGLQVDLVEGSLRVERIGGGQAAVVLKPGQRYSGGHSPPVIEADVSAAAAWSDGRLVFDDISLTDVSADLERQTGQTLTFADPRLARLRFSGVLRLDRSEDWKLGLEAALPVRLARTDRGYRVSRR